MIDLLVLFFLITFGVAHSGECPFECAGELLYLKPNVDDAHYVLSSIDETYGGSLFPNGRRYQNATSFSPGFRVEGLYSCLGARFTYFQAQYTDSVSGDFLYDTNGFPGFGAQASPVYAGRASSKNSYTFYEGALNYNRPLSCFFPDHLRFIVGLQGVYIQFKEHTRSSGTFTNNQAIVPLLNNLHRHSLSYGIGLQVGFDYQFLLSQLYCMPGQWSLIAKARSSLLCTNTTSDLTYVTLHTGPGGVGVRNGNTWRTLPAASFDLGIHYNLHCGGFCTTVECGYELMWYSQSINKITGLDVAFAGDAIDLYQSFSLQGPYLRICFAF